MKESELYFKFLLHVASADGVADDDEIDLIHHSMQAVGLSDDLVREIESQIATIKSKGKMEGLEQLIDGIKQLENPSFLMTLIRDSYALATADDDLAQTEIKVIQSLFYAVCKSDESMFDEVMRWAKDSLAVKVRGEELYLKMCEAV